MPMDMTPFRGAIRRIESDGSGGYSAIGPTHPTYGRALGAYQVMEANLPQWTQAALGREVGPDEFLKNPAVQDAVFDHRFGSLIQKYGNPQDAASAWLTGRPLAQGANSADVNGTTGAAYVDKFNAGLGIGAGAAATGQPMTMPAGTTGTPTPAAAPAATEEDPLKALQGLLAQQPAAKGTGLLAQPQDAYAPTPDRILGGAPPRGAMARGLLSMLSHRSR